MPVEVMQGWSNFPVSYLIGISEILLVAIAIWLTLLLLHAIAGGWVDGKERIRTSPREPMEWCHKHGFFRLKHVLTLPIGGTTVTICPKCYLQSIQQAQKPVRNDNDTKGAK